MPPPPIVARTAREVARRAFSSVRPPSSMAEELFMLDEVERAHVMKVLHKVDAEMKMKIDKQVELAKEARSYGDHIGFTNWLCDRCGVPMGEFRDMLIWRCFLGGIFLTAGAVGRFCAKRDLRRWEKEISDASDDNV